MLINDDLISRVALLDKIRQKMFDTRYDIELAMDVIKTTPAVDAVPVVHGDWIPKETMIRHPWAFNHYCSVCKSDANMLTPYCPNCGAKMDGAK